VCSSTGTTSTPADPDVVALLSAGENRTEVTQLTTREREVLTELAYGRSNLEIARLFGVSEKTVKTHVSATLRKLAVHDRTQAALHAMRAGLVDS
jgi:DNA-binding NarL/FixJ family response regulator